METQIQAKPPIMPLPPQQQNYVNKYQSRNYTPYVFQPNFLKQQSSFKVINNEAGVKVVHADQAGNGEEEDPKKKAGRKVIDWTSSCVLYVERRRYQRVQFDVPKLLPDQSYALELQAALAYRSNPVSSVCTRFVRSATNKNKCPVFKVVWTPDGRRLVTGSASGEFTLWNGSAFNFETILQAHDNSVRAMAWSKQDN